MTIVVDDAATQALIRSLADRLGNTAPIMREVGLGLRNYVRQTIVIGGRSPWPPLSRLTIASKGRTKPLTGLESQIHYASNADTAVVYWQNSRANGWDINIHDRGYRFGPALGRPVMRVNIMGGRPIFFKRRRGGTVPARPVWPDLVEATVVAQGIVNGMGRRIFGASWP